MQPATALLVSSTDLNWVGLRAILAGWPEVHVIDDVQQREHALPIVAREHPDLILVASDLAGLRLVPLVRDLRAASPCSRIVVLGQFLEPGTYSQLDALGVAGFVQWLASSSGRLQPRDSSGWPSPPSGRARCTWDTKGMVQLYTAT